MPRRSTEQENEKYVLRALTETKDGAGVKEARHRANRLLGNDGSRRQLTESQARAVLESLESQGKVAKQGTEPATWLITPRGRRFL